MAALQPLRLNGSGHIYKLSQIPLMWPILGHEWLLKPGKEYVERKRGAGSAGRVLQRIFTPPFACLCPHS